MTKAYPDGYLNPTDIEVYYEMNSELYDAIMDALKNMPDGVISAWDLVHRSEVYTKYGERSVIALMSLESLGLLRSVIKKRAIRQDRWRQFKNWKTIQNALAFFKAILPHRLKDSSDLIGYQVTRKGIDLIQIRYVEGKFPPNH